MLIDINKIIFSLFFAFLCGFTTILLQSKFSYIVLLIFCIVFLLYFGLFRIHYQNNKLDTLTGIFFFAVVLLDILAKPHIKDIAGGIIFALGYIFLLITVYFLISYKSMVEILVNSKSSYIIKENFKYAFIPAAIFTIIYSIIGYFFALSVKELGFSLALTLYLVLSYLLLMLFMWKVIEYKYAFKLLCLLDNKKVPYTDINLYPESDKIKFVEKFIYPYINNVQFYDDKFIVDDISYPKKAEENKKLEVNDINETTLSESIRKLDNIIKNAENSSEVVYNVLCN